MEAQLTCISLHACQELQLVLFTKKEKSIKAFGKGISLKNYGSCQSCGKIEKLGDEILCRCVCSRNLTHIRERNKILT